MASIPSKKTRIRVSKNRKKSWGKYCDIKDIEDFLEDQRLEERTGGSISLKPDEELFAVDTKKQFKKAKGKFSLKRKKVTGLENLKCHQGLTAYSAVRPPVNPQKRPLGKKKKLLLAQKENKKLQKVLNASQKPKKEKSSPTQFRDLWAEEEREELDPAIEDHIKYRDEILKSGSVNIPVHRFQKPSLLPAVEVPHPGASYNPTFNEHQELLSKAVVIEEKKLKDELHLYRVLNNMFPSKEDAPTEETYIKEMSQGLFDEEEKTEIQDGDCTLFANPRVTDEFRKSKSKRRKEKLLKQQLRKRKLDREMNKRMSDVFRLKRIKAEIKEEDQISAERQANKQQREIEKMYKPRTLSCHKFEPADLEVNLTEELPESMRVLKAEGNLFEDRYKSLQKRNIIETRIRKSRKRKYKLKVQIKRNHRNFQ